MSAMESAFTIADVLPRNDEHAPQHATAISHSQTAHIAPQRNHEIIYAWPDHRPERAIHHEHIRAQLLQEAEAKSAWVHQQPHGTAPDDRTAPVAFPADQPTWGFEDRAHYPPINFVIERRGYKHPNYEVLPFYYNGLLVLDLDGNPIRNFHHLPPTISSKIHGGHIEALMRFDSRTTYADIRARMPPKVAIYKNGQTVERPLRKVGALSAAAARYREMAGCLNWQNRMGSETLNNYILDNLPEDLKAKNSTKGWRPLTKDDITALRAPAIGSRPYQARKRASSVEVRRKRNESIKKRRTMAKAARANLKRGRSQPRAKPIGSDLTTGQLPVFSMAGSPDQDSHTKKPHGKREIEALQKAISPSVLHLISLLGVEPVKHRLLSYEDQISNLQSQVNETYRSFNDGMEDPPALVRLIGWTGGIENWPSAKFWDGQNFYRIDGEGGIGALMSGNDDLTATNEAAGDDDLRQTKSLSGEEDLPDGSMRPFDEEISSIIATQSRSTSENDSDSEPVAGGFLVNARGDRILPANPSVNNGGSQTFSYRRSSRGLLED
ncbi:MAG: hypothetical protein Q9170_006837 [Blastenia crenularia]